jgi:excisionase family DNA binding protein
MSTLLDKTAVAERLGISVRTVDRLRKTGQLRAIKVGNSVRFTEGSLENYLNGQTEDLDSHVPANLAELLKKARRESPLGCPSDRTG